MLHRPATYTCLSLILAAALQTAACSGGGSGGGSGSGSGSGSGGGGGSGSGSGSGSGGGSASGSGGGSASGSGGAGGSGTGGAGGAFDPGTLVGDFYITYYYLVDETDYAGGDDTTLVDSNCQPVASVPQAFAADACIEGSGRLAEGVVINYDSQCACGFPCALGGKICFTKLDAAQFPWGMGSKSNALEPLRSWAVDNTVIPYGTVLYAKEWDGVVIPSAGGLGGFVHDGCFRADDIGGAIQGNHFDFFAGNTAMWQKLEAIHPSIESHFTVYESTQKCAFLGP